MITNFDDFCTWLYVVVDDFWQQLAKFYTHPGPAPSKCSDSELITLAILAECRGWQVETEMVSHFQSLRHLFPNLPERSRFNRRRRNLMVAINALRQALLKVLDLAYDTQCVIDSLPITIIEFKKAHFSPARSYWRSYGANYGKIATKRQTIFGYKLHLLITLNGLILDFSLTGANEADLVAGTELLTQQKAKVVLADKAYLSKPKQEYLLQTQAVKLLTLPRQNQKEQAQVSSKQRHLHNHFRQLVEVVNSQLAEQFNIEHTFAKSFWGLCARLYTKLTGHTLLMYLKRMLGLSDFLQIKAVAFSN